MYVHFNNAVFYVNRVLTRMQVKTLLIKYNSFTLVIYNESK